MKDKSIKDLILHLVECGASVIHNKSTGSLKLVRCGVGNHDGENILLLDPDLILLVYPEIKSIKNWSILGISKGVFDCLEYDPYVKEWL